MPPADKHELIGRLKGKIRPQQMPALSQPRFVAETWSNSVFEVEFPTGTDRAPIGISSRVYNEHDIQ